MWDLNSPCRDGTHVPCIGRQILNHWTTREVPEYFSFFRFFFLMWAIFEVFIELVTVLLLFYVLVFWLGDMWYSSLWGVWAGIEPVPLHCIGGWSPNWISREVPHWSMSNPVPPVTLFLKSQDSGHEVTILRKNKMPGQLWKSKILK